MHNLQDTKSWGTLSQRKASAPYQWVLLTVPYDRTDRLHSPVFLAVYILSKIRVELCTKISYIYVLVLFELTYSRDNL